MNLKERYRQYKKWQLKPFSFEITNKEPHHCNACGHDFTGNYCPYCSQKAGVGRITWKSVWEGVLELWGFGSRSMTYTIWQLFTRPGYLIGDYIGGNRQVSFPPVKMLFILAVIKSILQGWLIPAKVVQEASTKTAFSGIDQFTIWAEQHEGWSTLLMTCFVIPYTWRFFRHAPRHDHHTLPESFFIQVFLSSLTLIVDFFVMLILPNPIYTNVSIVCSVLIYLITYWQLFGYGFWGTAWRTALVLLCSLATLVVFFLVLYVFWR